jgi:hypothetical protein
MSAGRSKAGERKDEASHHDNHDHEASGGSDFGPLTDHAYRGCAI